MIVSDGAYGVSGFEGDPPTYRRLPQWYEPHIRAWSRAATPETTLWFWNTEIGWATVHPVLAQAGWEYRNCHIWNKGLGHIAGNCNSQTLRKFPVVTEVCVQYVREVRFETPAGSLRMQEWLRHEWERTGLPLSSTNAACGVRNAATRKYFTSDHMWYFPPAEAFERLAAYANKHGKAEGMPYFSRDGQRPISGDEWLRMRAKFYCEHGVMNVWDEPAMHGEERLKDRQNRCVHLNQKPLSLLGAFYGPLPTQATSCGNPSADCAASLSPACISAADAIAPKYRLNISNWPRFAWRMNVQSPPTPKPPAKNWEHRALYERVRETLVALPAYFKPETFIAGLLATDIFSLSAALGATIEAEVVNSLNDLRNAWDPEQKYANFSFVRQPQTFPDVRLQRYKDDGSVEIVLGVELKGWYLLAKEGEPTFRFHASPGACAPQDLLVVYPWALANVISGRRSCFGRLWSKLHMRPSSGITTGRNNGKGKLAIGHWSWRPTPSPTLKKLTRFPTMPRETPEIISRGWPEQGSWTLTRSP